MALRSKAFSQLSGILAIGILLAAGGLAAWKMWTLPLWGWWPLLLLLSFWMAIILIFLPKDPTEKKWLGAATLSGVMLGLGFPPSPLTWIVLFAWIPLLSLESGIFHQRDRVNPRKVFYYSFHAFVLWNVIATFWVTNTAFVAGIVANFLNAAFMATVMVMIHLVRHQLPRRAFIWVFISLWISFEYLHHFWDLSWPWLTLGNALAQYPWAAQWYEYTGIFGGSLWILMVNFYGDDMINRWLRARPLFWGRYAAILVLPIALSLWLWNTTTEDNAEPVPVTIVQPNFEPHYEKFDIPQREQSFRFYELSTQHINANTRYLVFPETSFEGIRLNTFRENPVIQLFQAMVDSFPQLRLVAGISSFRVLDPDHLEGTQYRTHIGTNGDTILWDIQNAAIQLTAGQEEYQVYFKSKLVPGPEMFPFRKVLFFMKPIVDKLGGSYQGHTTQKERSVFTGGPLVVAPMICYESVYGAYTGEYVQKGATALFIVTNDGWWDKTPGHIQHLKIGALRAIEHRRPIARSANTGISAFIDIKGRIHQPTLYGETTAISGTIIPETRITFYTRWGDVIAKTAVMILCVVMLLALRIYLLKKLKSA